jgi:Mrp family chromosome partitioning ATPase
MAVTGEPQSREVEQNVLTSIRSHWRLIAVVVALYAGVSALVAYARPVEYIAEAQMVLEDPRSTPLADVRSDRDESRYVDSQVAFLGSTAVAERARIVARNADPPKVFETRTIQRKATIDSTPDSNHVVVRFRARDPVTAAVGANAIIQAYRDLVRSDLTADTEAALSRLDVALDEAERNLSAGVRGPEEQAEAGELLRELRLQRARLRVNAELSGDGVALASPARPGNPRGTPWLAALAVGLVLGGLTGIGLAYWLDSRRQTFSGRLEPLALVGSPALAEIQDFRREKIRSALPVRDAPGSESSEAFRFLASGIGASPEHDGVYAHGSAHANGRAAVERSVAFVSASPGDGATTIAANTAIAAAQQGYRVLAIDADLGTRGLSRLLLGSDAPGDAAGVAAAGFGEMLRQGVAPENIRHVMQSGGAETAGVLDEILRRGTAANSTRQVMRTGAGGSLELLGPGTTDARKSRRPSADEALATVDDRIPAVLHALREHYDLVIIDVPPVLQSSYADTLIRSTAAVVLVVPHRSEVSRLRSVLDRFDLLGIRPTGYVYNRAPAPQRRWPLHDPSRAAIARAGAKTEVA